MNLNDYMHIPFDSSSDSKEDLRELLPIIGSNIDFDSEKWCCDKWKRDKVHGSNYYTIYFVNTDDCYIEYVKYFVLIMAMKGKKIKTIKNYAEDLKSFLQFLIKEYNSVDLDLVTETLMYEYKTYLDIKYTSEDTKHGKWSAVSVFYRDMYNFEGKFKQNPISENPFEKKRNDPNKYIPKYITDQTDVLFKDENIPLHIRVVYWILRFIPSRISEVLGLKLIDINETKEGWLLTLPTWKQNGGYEQPQPRFIRFLRESVEGEYLFNLIMRQREIALSLQDEVEDDEKGYLLTYYVPYFLGRHYKKTGERKYSDSSVVNVMSYSTPNEFFRAMGERYNIKNKEEVSTYFTTHQLRHNGITDRLHEGFETVHIKSMTQHQNDKMIIDNYNHPDKGIFREKQRMVLDKKSGVEEKNVVYFKGRILNIDSMMEKRLLRNIRAHKMKYGICSDITGCKNKYTCLECDKFIPNVEDLSYFEYEVKQWSKKLKFFKEQNHKFMVEHAEHNLQVNKGIVEKIISVLNSEEMEKNYGPNSCELRK